MIYKHHGLGHDFVSGYPEYFGDAVDQEAVRYLTLVSLACAFYNTKSYHNLPG